jgi:putative ABC transport system substrate-binding protein
MKRDEDRVRDRERRGPITNRMHWALVFLFISVAVSISVFPAQAQERGRIPRIGLLSGSSASAVSDRVETFRQGLRERGYIEGQNVAIDYRYAEGKLQALPELAAELVRFKMDVIVTTGPAATRPAKQATEQSESADPLRGTIETIR